MTTLIFVLWILALVFALVAAAGKLPLWISVVMLCVIGLLQYIPTHWAIR